MSKRTLTLAFVMDPVEGEDFAASTSIVWMLEAQRRGHEVLYVDPAKLGIHGGRAAVRARPVRLHPQEDPRIQWGEERNLILDDEVDAVVQRKDPPVDAEYICATQILGTCRTTLVFNRPTSLLAYNEKLLALHFPQWTPETRVTRHIPELRDFMQALGGEMIVKPLDGKGGEGIFLVSEGDRNLGSILEQSTRYGQQRVMAQRYLPEVKDGDKRILLLEGEALGAVLRVPAAGEVRANFHVGGRAAAAKLDDRDQQIVASLAPMMRREGLFFVGIDVIGGQLTEINITSPTGVQEINALNKTRLEEQLMDRLEAKVSETRSQP